MGKEFLGNINFGQFGNAFIRQMGRETAHDAYKNTKRVIKERNVNNDIPAEPKTKGIWERIVNMCKFVVIFFLVVIPIGMCNSLNNDESTDTSTEVMNVAAAATTKEITTSNSTTAVSTKASSTKSNERVYYTGPRGGIYYYSKNGKKVYVKKK